MTRSIGARVMTFEELVAMGKEKMEAPTVDGLIFMDCVPNPKRGNKRQLFACYVTKVAYDSKALGDTSGEKSNDEDADMTDQLTVDKAVALEIGLIQWAGGVPQVLLMKVGRDRIEKGDIVRFWNDAPSQVLLDKRPFPPYKEKETEKT